MKTIGIFSKCGMPGGSEHRVVQLANGFSQNLQTSIFTQKTLSDKLKPLLNPNVTLYENAVSTKNCIYKLQALDILIVVNSDSYSFCKKSFWDGTQGKHHTNNIDLSQIPHLAFLFNYVVGPAQWLTEIYKINPNLKIFCTSEWFMKNLQEESKFDKLRPLNIPSMSICSPVSISYSQPKTPSDKIRINRHSMGFAYKHDQDNLKIVKTLCEKYGDKISFKWMGVPSHVRDVNGQDKDEKVVYKEVLEKYPQFTVIPEYSVTVPNLLKETDILLFYISRHRKEPWPRTIAEGMMGSCCCVTNNNYGMAEQIKNGETGYLFDNTDQAIEQLSYLIENSTVIKDVGNNAQKFAKENFLDEVIIEKMLKFLVS